ncbi:MAG: hypothetical protein ACQEQV_05965 [Fibrobacterota bacterium]
MNRILLLLCGVVSFAAGAGFEHGLPQIGTREGETLGARALFVDDYGPVVYSDAASMVVFYTPEGTVRDTLILEGIGRGSYCGDDFVLRDDSLVFLNTVDMRLEYYRSENGKWILSRPLPADLCSGDSPADRLPLRIALQGDSLCIGSRTGWYSYPSGRACAVRGAITPRRSTFNSPDRELWPKKERQGAWMLTADSCRRIDGEHE